MNAARGRLVTLGQVVGVHGVKGGIKIVSHTRPRDNIFSYPQWWLRQPGRDWQSYELKGGRQQGKGLVAELSDVSDRDAARNLMGAEIAIERGELPALPAGEYYWCDLIGLTVRRDNGELLGQVIDLEETGANDVLVVQDTAGRERLIPYVMGHVVLTVDLEAGCLTVDWQTDPE